jgi:hypothetical protein
MQISALYDASIAMDVKNPTYNLRDLYASIANLKWRYGS